MILRGVALGLGHGGGELLVGMPSLGGEALAWMCVEVVGDPADIAGEVDQPDPLVAEEGLGSAPG